MKKKFLTAALLTFAALTLVVVTVFVTLAFLADSSAVSNTFTVGNVGIDMKETKVDENGEAVEPAEKVDGNSYHLRPNCTYTKDPTIVIETTNANDKMFLFVKSNNMIRGIEAGNIVDDPNANKPTMRAQMEANGWVEFIRSEDGVEIVWVYGTRGNDGVIIPTAVSCDSRQLDENDAPKGQFKLCNEFTIGNVDNAALNLYGGTTVTFTGFAIQSSNDATANNLLVKNSWEAIKATFPVNCNIVNPQNPYYTKPADGVAQYGPYDPVPNVDEPVQVTQ